MVSGSSSLGSSPDVRAQIVFTEDDMSYFSATSLLKIARLLFCQREVLTRMVLILQTCWCKIAFTRTLKRVPNAQPVQKPRLSEKIVSRRDVRTYSGECLITFADELFFFVSHQLWESPLCVCPAHVCSPWSMPWKKQGLRSAKEMSILSWVSKARDYNNCCCLFSTIIIGCSKGG